MFKSQQSRASKLELITRAAKSDMQVFRSFHGCYIWDKGNLVSIAFNNSKGDSKANKHFPFASQGIHAEFKAILRAGDRDFSNCELYVCRIGNHGKVALSKPCEFCNKIIAKLGFKSVFYSDDDGWKKLV